jgi:penicillin amidase
MRTEARLAEQPDEIEYGSNNWAVAGLHTASGAALLANDMHLTLRVPGTWYRIRLQVAASEDARPALDITGVTLAGGPLMVAGSNGSIAWGFTNSYGDFCDLVLLDTEPAAPNQYLTPDGPRTFEHARETLHVHGGEDVVLDVRRTIWGPVLDEDLRGRLRAGVWTAHFPEATNLALWQLERTVDVPGALDVAARGGIPPQNFVVADASGNIGWTIMGRIPLRVGFDSSVPASWSAPGVGWQGWLAPAAYPRLVNPPQGRIWTANQRTVDGRALEIIGDHGYAFGARASQIRDDLLARETLAESDMLAIQLDDHSRIHERWRKKLLEVLDEEALLDQPDRIEARRLVEGWLGRAATNSAGFRILRGWRDRLRDRTLAALTTEVRAKDPNFKVTLLSRFEGPLWRLVDAEPVHLLDPAFASWRDFELAMLDELITELKGECSSLAACTWGKRNRVEVRHPLSRAIPLLRELTDMPTVELPGDIYAVRVQGPAFGASERFGVSPGHEADAYMHMPGGQSGHPLSPYYRAGFDAWSEGRPLPFLPGSARHRLTFTPSK